MDIIYKESSQWWKRNEGDAMKQGKKYALNLLLIIIVTVFAVWFALKDNYEEVLRLISEMPWYFLLIIMAWGIIYTLVIGWIYKVLGRRYRKDYRFIHGAVIAFVGSFFSGITPSATGGQFAQAYILKKQGIKISDGASLLWADFIVYQTTMMVYVTVLFLLKFGYYSAQSGWFNLILVGYLINLAVIAALYTMALFPKVYVKLSAVVVNLLAKLHLIKDREKTLEGWNLQLASFTSEIKKLTKDKKMIVKTSAINVLRMTLQFSLPYFIALMMGISLQPGQLLDVIALSSFVMMANSFIPIPGASGGTEVVFTLMFSGMLGAWTGAVMILWRFSTYHLVMIVGAAVFVLAKRYYDRKKLKEDEIGIQNEEVL